MKIGEPKVLATGFYLLEAPRWFDNQLFVSDFFGLRVIKFPSPVTGVHETYCVIPGQPSGLGFAKDGSLRIVSMLDRKLFKWDGLELELVADLSGYFKTEANDMAMDEDGRCYIGSFGLAHFDSTNLEASPLLRVDIDGSVTVAAENLTFPNGIVFSEDGKTLYVAETYIGRVTSFSVLENGQLGERKTWRQFGTVPPVMEIKSATEHLPILPDGLALDSEGAIWVADAKGHGISRVLPSGETVEFVETGNLSVYAATFGGPEMKTLFLCCAPPVESYNPRTSKRSVLMSYKGSVVGVKRR
jgi:sugar lactone lactonase YvrE